MENNELIRIQCNWSEMVNGKLVYCEDTDTIKDDFNVNDRWFCIRKHIREVERTRFKLYLKMKEFYEN